MGLTDMKKSLTINKKNSCPETTKSKLDKTLLNRTMSTTLPSLPDQHNPSRNCLHLSYDLSLPS